MRRYQRLGIMLMLLVCGAWFTVPVFINYTQAWLQHLQLADNNTLKNSARSSLVYILKPKQWLSFVLPEESSQLRILSNAHIPAIDALAIDPNWTYAIRYELRDKQGVLLHSGLYNQRSRLTLYKEANGAPTYNSYYTDKSVLPLDGRLILFGQQAIKGAAVLRLCLESINPVISEAAVRVYVPIKLSEHRISTVWLRMTQEQRDNLAQYSIYPESLLSSAEQINLLKHQWLPLGPMGVDDEDYTTLNLYSLTDKEIDDQDAPVILAAGLQADANHYGVIPISEQGGQLSLRFTALNGAALTKPVTSVLQWYGRDIKQRWQQTALWNNDTTALEYPIEGGLLVIRPYAPVIISASLTTADKVTQDITDTLLSVKSYISKAGVNFDVLHYQQQPSAMRIDVRRLLTPLLKAQPERVQYQALNAQQQIIARGELTALDAPSLFDRAGDIIDANNVSDPISYYFQLPNTVTQLRLISNSPALLVSAYNQPYGMIKSQRVPEDAYIDNDKQTLDLTWFPVRAHNDETLTQQFAVQWLSGQYRPPEDKPDVLAGAYLWQDFLPEGDNIAARYILTDYTDDEPRADALANMYCAFAVNRNVQVNLAAFHGLRSVTPELIYLRANSTPFMAELLANQEKVFTMNAMGQQGIMRIPETALGANPLRLHTDGGGRWLMNYQTTCTGERYLKRRVFALNANAPLAFTVQHSTDDEVLSVRLYSPAHTTERSQINVTIEAVHANTPVGVQYSSNKWTYTHRLYDIRPLAATAMPVLYTQNQTLSNGERFAIPLNSDLPAGAYRIRLALAQGSAGFVTFSHVKAGVYEQRRFFRETQLESKQ